MALSVLCRRHGRIPALYVVCTGCEALILLQGAPEVHECGYRLLPINSQHNAICGELVCSFCGLNRAALSPFQPFM